MKDRKYRHTELGMLLGLVIGSGLATILFATTGQALYFAFVGIGLALGLALGAAFDGAQRSAPQSNDGLEE